MNKVREIFDKAAQDAQKSLRLALEAHPNDGTNAGWFIHQVCAFMEMKNRELFGPREEGE